MEIVCDVPVALVVNTVICLFWMDGKTWMRMVMQWGAVVVGTGGEPEP